MTSLSESVSMLAVRWGKPFPQWKARTDDARAQLKSLPSLDVAAGRRSGARSDSRPWSSTLDGIESEQTICDRRTHRQITDELHTLCSNQTPLFRNSRC